MIHPRSEIRFLREAIGQGMVATAFIPKGTLLWVRDALDITLSPEEVLRAPHRALIEKHSFIDADGQYVLCWDGGRSMNHSCDPSGRGYKQLFEIARRDIQPGEEINCEYGGLNITRGFPCCCEAPACRGTIHPDDALHFGARWREEALALIRMIPSVPQPLWPFAEALVEDPGVVAEMKNRFVPDDAFGEVGLGPWSLIR